MMLLATMASLMMFVAMTGGYIILRFGGGQWPPAGMPALPSALWGNTGLIVLSSVGLARAQVSVRQDRSGGLRFGLTGAVLLGLGFLLGQVYVWRTLQAAGLYVNTGVYGSIFYLLTIMHALHVAAGLAGLSYVLLLSCRGVFDSRQYLAVDVAGIFWHFVGAVWVYLFVILYLI
jgi:cytochrome c oxidase subunit 3